MRGALTPSSHPLVNTMLEAALILRPPHSTVAHILRGCTPHCCTQPLAVASASQGSDQNMSVTACQQGHHRAELGWGASLGCGGAHEVPGDLTRLCVVVFAHMCGLLQRKPRGPCRLDVLVLPEHSLFLRQ